MSSSGKPSRGGDQGDDHRERGEHVGAGVGGVGDEELALEALALAPLVARDAEVDGDGREHDHEVERADAGSTGCCEAAEASARIW